VPTLSAKESIESFNAFTAAELQDLVDTACRRATNLGVDKDHALIIDAYTRESDLYKTATRMCREYSQQSQKLLAKHRDFLYHLEQAWSTCGSSHVGKTHRAIRVKVNKQIYKKGESITWQAPSSASARQMVPVDFAGHLESDTTKLTGTWFVVYSKSGKAIHECSAFPEEEEVLFKTNSFFKITEVCETLAEKAGLLPEVAACAYDLSSLDVFVLQQL